MAVSIAFFTNGGLISLFLLCGLLACVFIGMVWDDTRDDERDEMQDSEPSIKVVQFSPLVTDREEYARLQEDAYRRMVERFQANVKVGQDAEKASVNALGEAQREMRDYLRKRRASDDNEVA